MKSEHVSLLSSVRVSLIPSTPSADGASDSFLRSTDLLSAHSLSLLHLTHLTLYLSPALMPQFASINAIYSTYFGTSPPTRACVGVALPKGRRLELEGVARVEDGSAVGRKSLHVQSLSYWAGANIGPYSQSITVRYNHFGSPPYFLQPFD